MKQNMFEKTSWSWQLSVLRQQVGEWVEYQLSRLKLNLPQLPNGWSIDNSWLGKLLNFVFWLLLALFLIWFSWRLWRVFSPYLYARLRGRNIANSELKIRHSDLSVSEWLLRSQELYHQNNYPEACRCLYLAMLQHLHDTSIAPHKFSRTDGEYLQLLQYKATPMQPYETLITTHEQLCFGNTDISLENYQQCREAYREIGNGEWGMGNGE
ncbi:DUF4129 domain-containing protein [Plectonema radiosum NIES-515]|uniref:DUF4129 domain-containing protein n=1 Tax=Plectonema radiosum NIES-515 TaxID=2986073 RepID=A0ABT3AUP9_9CYAN|nr:DUF4129 domain-containing protein [Plectonema radiosum]MCV3212826.1 DUF4129 domain-containing protein [Plectonema radiosum NIES-515]